MSIVAIPEIRDIFCFVDFDAGRRRITSRTVSGIRNPEKRSRIKMDARSLTTSKIVIFAESKSEVESDSFLNPVRLSRHRQDLH
jgi:hypothetical protein